MARRRGSKLDSFETASTNRIVPGHQLHVQHTHSRYSMRFSPPQIAFPPEDQVPLESRSSGMNWKRTSSSKHSRPMHLWA
jgi:hypothetical protein